MTEIGAGEARVLGESKIAVLGHANNLANRAFRDLERLRLGRRPKGFQGVGTNQRISFQGGEDHGLVPTTLRPPSVRHQCPPTDFHDCPTLLPNAFITMNAGILDVNPTRMNSSGSNGMTSPPQPDGSRPERQRADLGCVNRTCSSCCRRLPVGQFPPADRRRSTCRLCEADEQRARSRLAPVRSDPMEVRLNNQFNLWFGPVRREPLRNAA